VRNHIEQLEPVTGKAFLILQVRIKRCLWFPATKYDQICVHLASLGKGWPACAVSKWFVADLPPSIKIPWWRLSFLTLWWKDSDSSAGLHNFDGCTLPPLTTGCRVSGCVSGWCKWCSSISDWQGIGSLVDPKSKANQDLAGALCDCTDQCLGILGRGVRYTKCSACDDCSVAKPFPCCHEPFLT
jgi:hypothetical protein